MTEEKMDYSSNSKKSKEKKDSPDAVDRKVEKVIETEVIQRKKPMGRRFKELFFGGEFQSAARYIAADVLLPAVRNLLVDASTEGIKRIVYGDSTARRRTGGGPLGPRVSYHSSSVSRDPRTYRDFRPPDQGPRPLPSRRENNEIVLAQRSDAETVLERLIDILDTYQVASVADLHDLVGLPTSHVDNKWGWTYLANAEIRQVREGWVLELPPTEPI